VGGLDVLLAFQVGDRPGHLQDPCVGPGAQPEPVNGQLDEFLAGVVDLSVLLNYARLEGKGGYV